MQALQARIASLRVDSPALWGNMSAPEMLHHLNLAIGSGLGYFTLEDSSHLLSRTMVKILVLRVLKRFPKNTRTPSILEVRGDFDFAKEKGLLLEILQKAHNSPEDKDWQAHTYFGRMGAKDWSRLVVMHCDHHLRQFGL